MTMHETAHDTTPEAPVTGRNDPPRIALLHTGAVVIEPIMSIVKDQIPGVVAINYLDDRIVPDLADPAAAESVPRRVAALAGAAKAAGASIMMLSCSSISELADRTSTQVGIPILRIDEAMADEAVATGRRITVIATLGTTCEPTTRLILERARLAGRDPELRSIVVDGAFKAVTSGDRTTHDRKISEAVQSAATTCDVVVLAQASMASAARAVEVNVPVLTSLESGVKRLKQLLDLSPVHG